MSTNDAERIVHKFDEFYKSKNANYGYLDSLMLVGEGNKTFNRTQEKYGIPVVKFNLSLGRGDGDYKKWASTEDKDYFEKFSSYVTLFPEVGWVLNHNGTIFSTDDISSGKIFRQCRFQGDKSYKAELEMYRELSRLTDINFKEIELPFDYLWDNKGTRRYYPNCYTVNVGKNLRLNLVDRRINLA